MGGHPGNPYRLLMVLKAACPPLLMLIDYGHDKVLQVTDLAILLGTPMSGDSRKYDVAVAYRIYPKMAKPALGLPFSDDKERLSEVCLQSFRRSLGDLRAKIWVLLDDCPPHYEEMFRRVFAPEDLVLEPLPGIGNQGTFNRQIEILL
jgi:hypothetical protein